MKRLLAFLLSFALGVTFLLGGVIAVSYKMTEIDGLPSPQVLLNGESLEPSIRSWAIPLTGGAVDKRFYTTDGQMIQQLGDVPRTHPELTSPAWANDSRVIVRDAEGVKLFEGTVAEYARYLYPENGEYRLDVTFWRLPAGVGRGKWAAYETSKRGRLVMHPGDEHPAKPLGSDTYRLQFTIVAEPEIELSSDVLSQGGVIGMLITGMVGDEPPTVETELCPVQCTRCVGGWRCYLAAAYNTSAGEYAVNITANGQTVTRTVRVTGKEFGTVVVQPEPDLGEAANQEFRNAVWPLYETPALEKRWSGKWISPVKNALVLVEYGQMKSVNGKKTGRSNSTKLYTVPGDPVFAPANGRVVLAQELALTGNTVVIDHGCGLKSYLYGLGSIAANVGDNISRGMEIGTAGEELTVDYKLGNKSINPQQLYQGVGGIFWQEQL